WCQSYGADVGPPHTDLHHMRPESAPVNSSRGNNFYDVCLSNAPGYKATTNVLQGWVWKRTTSLWEPPDETKGEIARSMLYMTVRYTGDKSNEPAMILTDDTNLITTANTFMGRYTTLLKWHFEHPVTDGERVRNDSVYSLYQTNRNPFVDHPEWVASAFLPPLLAASTSTNLTLYWTNDYAPTFVVEESTNLLSWTTLTNAPALTNGNWAVYVNLTNGAHFYRQRLN
ncbi:MAG: endonuclease, partial [Verrucomicrobiota bacterium]